MTTFVAPGEAVCIYHGVDNAKTTIPQEFRDSAWVVRAHVVSADYHWADSGDSWTRYRLRVERSYKGHLPRYFTFFTMRDSGGFYMDGDNGSPDFNDYLLFLDGRPWRTSAAAKVSVWVNYNCGQSGSWAKLTAKQQAQLEALARP